MGINEIKFEEEETEELPLVEGVVEEATLLSKEDFFYDCAYETWMEYYMDTEKHDRLVCSGPIVNGTIVPRETFADQAFLKI